MATSQEILGRLIPKKDEAPHRSVIWVSADTYEVTKHGECSGMSKHTIKRFPLYIDGADKFIAIRKLNEALEELKRLCNETK